MENDREQFHVLTVGQAFFPRPCFLSIIQVLIFSFIIHIFPLLLTAGDSLNLSYLAVKEISYISTSLERMTTLDSNTGLRRNSSLLPSAWFHCRKLHQEYNYFIHADSLKHNLPKLFHLCSIVYMYTQSHRYRKMFELSIPIVKRGGGG